MKAFPGVSQAAKLERFLIPWCKSEFGPVDFSARRNRWPLLPSLVFCHEPVGIVWRYRVLGDLLWCLANCAFQGPLDSFHRAIPLCRGDLEPHTPGVSINQQPSFCGPRRWSTDAVPATQRLDYWVGAISEGFLAMEASGDAHAFHGELVSAPLGPVGVNWVQGAAHRVWRTPRGIARGGQRVAYLLGNHDSAWRVAQDGRDALMRPGDFVLVDARRPYRFDFPAGPSTVSLELPLDWLARWVAEPEAHTAQPFRADSAGWSAALAAFARPWRPDMATAPPLPAELLADQLGALLSLACCGAPLAYCVNAWPSPASPPRRWPPTWAVRCAACIARWPRHRRPLPSCSWPSAWPWPGRCSPTRHCAT